MEPASGILKGNSIYKVPDGKLIKVSLELKEGKIAIIRITGDFFIHPEEWVASLEDSLAGCPVERLEIAVREKASEDKIQMVGIGAGDIVHAIKTAIANTER